MRTEKCGTISARLDVRRPAARRPPQTVAAAVVVLPSSSWGISYASMTSRSMSSWSTFFSSILCPLANLSRQLLARSFAPFSPFFFFLLRPPSLRPPQIRASTFEVPCWLAVSFCTCRFPHLEEDFELGPRGAVFEEADDLAVQVRDWPVARLSPRKAVAERPQAGACRGTPNDPPTASRRSSRTSTPKRPAVLAPAPGA